MDTKNPEPGSAPAGPQAVRNVSGAASTLYTDAADALKAVREDYLYWTGKLTETSVQMCYAVLGANWAVFGSVDRILTNFWAKLSVLLVVLALGLAVLGSKLIGEQHRDRINYAEADAARWSREFAATAGKRDPWPFTAGIERLASYLRDAKTWLPLSAGVCFVVALFAR